MKRIVFMGTPEFGANVLETLITNNWNPILIICQPDKKFDRKKQIILSPVKQIALKHKIPLLQPEKIGDAFEKIKAFNPDLLLTAAYGQFVPKKILELFPLGAWNTHASLLPKLRGGAPIHWAIINNESETGVSLMRMVSKMDAGNVIAVRKTTISETETYQSLHAKLLKTTKKLIQKHFVEILNQTFCEIVQNEKKVTFGYNLQNNQTYIDWNSNATVINCLIRGLYDTPSAQTIHQNVIIKVHQSIKGEPTNQKLLNGTVLAITNKGVQVVCNNQQTIWLSKIQFPGKKALFVSQLINGNLAIKVGDQLTNYVA